MEQNENLTDEDVVKIIKKSYKKLCKVIDKYIAENKPNGYELLADDYFKVVANLHQHTILAISNETRGETLLSTAYKGICEKYFVDFKNVCANVYNQILLKEKEEKND